MTGEKEESNIMDIFFKGILFVLFMVAIFKGPKIYMEYSRLKDEENKIEFKIKNNAPIDQLCNSIRSAISTAERYSNQKAFDKFQALHEKYTCNYY
ncbi:hypothetical protein [Acinetobacter baumannii]|uniref:hypothetical protein n=1 Tax=Acinetobacter baumannii TaxID=470 RepID=UPI000A35103E|nr:hypothetical protein [Acinetobacter baumannii]OTK47463.1 hypothetical protein B9X70_16160 [Acinetobacter baumannii]OTM34967.1 hypothetical protein B9X47_08930 [Acinetobacter baumannii]